MVGCSALAPIDQFLLLFSNDNSVKSVHQCDTHLYKVSEGPRPSQKDPLKNSQLEPILNTWKQGVPLQIDQFDEILIWANLAPKWPVQDWFFRARNVISTKRSYCRGTPCFQWFRIGLSFQFLSGSFWEGLGPSETLYRCVSWIRDSDAHSAESSPIIHLVFECWRCN